ANFEKGFLMIFRKNTFIPQTICEGKALPCPPGKVAGKRTKEEEKGLKGEEKSFFSEKKRFRI
ncbi:MAG: hypothetical protein J6A21_07115, partial [Lentisphaeria bacterium]|nr:hypothetical protein [Lentisphaeria bacterium]